MCSNGGFKLIILLLALIYNCVYIAESKTNTSSYSDRVNTATYANDDATTIAARNNSLHSGQHSPSAGFVSRNHRDYVVGDDAILENSLLHASADHASKQAAAHHVDGIVAGENVAGGQFIDITRKHKIHYNGIVVSDRFINVNIVKKTHTYTLVVIRINI